jgi:DNA modification methylase
VNRIVNGDVLRFAAHYRGPRFHAVLCDPPYELGFMGKSWDSRGVSFRAETWSAIGSLLAPGAHLLAFGGTRTFHRIAIAIEDAGFEIRDTLGWLYGSGFPKSHDVSKAIDREAGAEREVIGKTSVAGMFRQEYQIKQGYRPENNSGGYAGERDGAFITAPATDDARAWQGYGTALKPAWEPVIVARNPLVGTVAQNALKHGAGAINVDGARVGDEEITYIPGLTKNKNLNDDGWRKIGQSAERETSFGRWPANITHDGSDEVAEVLSDAQRFFYCAKAGKREKEEGLEGFDERRAGVMDGNAGISGQRTGGDGVTPVAPVFRRNRHPTVKPLALTQYLATLILPPQHVESRILVPFAGSGSECIGAALAGWHTVVGVEREAEYVRIAQARLEHWTRQKPLPA